MEKETATHSSILAWGIPWTEEPGRLQSMELQIVRHNLMIKQQQQKAWMKTRNPNHQTSKCSWLEASFPWLLPQLKNAFLMEAKLLKQVQSLLLETQHNK